MDRNSALAVLEPITHQDVKRIDLSSGKIMVGHETLAIRPSKGAKALSFSEQGKKDLLNFAGTPVGMIDKLCPDTQERVLNEVLARKQDFSVIVADNQVNSFVPNKNLHNAVKPDRLLRTIEKSLKGTVEYNRVHLMGALARIELTSDKRVPDPGPRNRGDLLQAGAVVQFSPLGIESPSVESYVLRLACTNGMTSTDVIQRFGYGEGDDIWRFFQNSVKQAVGAVNNIASRYEQMVNEQIPPEDRAAVLEAMIKRAKLPDNIADTVRARAIEQPPENSYQVLNMLSYASSHLMDDPHQVIRAQQAVAAFADETTHARICPACRKSR